MIKCKKDQIWLDLQDIVHKHIVYNEIQAPILQEV